MIGHEPVGLPVTRKGNKKKTGKAGKVKQHLTCTPLSSFTFFMGERMDDLKRITWVVVGAFYHFIRRCPGAVRSTGKLTFFCGRLFLMHNKHSLEVLGLTEQKRRVSFRKNRYQEYVK